MKTYTLVTTKIVLLITLVVILSTISATYLFNVQSHHTLYENSLFFLLFLALGLFVFITYGLYYGVKLKDNVGKLTDSIDLKKLPDFSGGVPDVSTVVEGLGGFILTAIVLFFLAWFFILSSWFLVVFLAAMLYWVYFRALRLVFKHSALCKDNIQLSVKYGVIYSLLYTSWAFAIIFGLHFFMIKG